MQSPDTRQRILLTALELFAHQGFSKTSTRQIALKAGVNLSSIKYYFGDKEGLYKATYTEPMKPADITLFTNKSSIEDVLEGLFMGFLAPLKENEQAKLCIKLHMRETLDTTGLWNNTIENDIKPHHEALVEILKKEIPHLKWDDTHRLAFSIISFGIFLYVGQDIIGQIKPSLIKDNQELDKWMQKFMLYSKAMINAEKLTA